MRITCTVQIHGCFSGFCLRRLVVERLRCPRIFGHNTGSYNETSSFCLDGASFKLDTMPPFGRHHQDRWFSRLDIFVISSGLVMVDLFFDSSSLEYISLPSDVRDWLIKKRF